MILSNSTQNSNMTKLVYQRSINSLADTLWNKSRSNHDLRLVVVVQENKNFNHGFLGTGKYPGKSRGL